MLGALHHGDESGAWLGTSVHGVEGTGHGPSRLHLGESAGQGGQGYGSFLDGSGMKDGAGQGLDGAVVVFGSNHGSGKGGSLSAGDGDGLDDGWGGDGLGLDDGRDDGDEGDMLKGMDGSRSRPKHSTKPRSVAERLRREKIAARLKKLKEVMPKTDARIDTSGMLEDAVIYIRSLQARCRALERQNAVLTGQVAEYARLVGELPSQNINGGM